MSKIIIFGTGGIAKLAHYYFSNDSEHQVVGFAVDSDYVKNKKFQDLPIIPFENIEKFYNPKYYKIFIAISYIQMNHLRAKKYYEAREKGYALISYISSKATIFSNIQLGDNCFILENNTIQPFVKIGNNVTLWSGNHIGHDVVIEDHCFISSQVVISGNTHIKSYCFVGVNATITNSITISSETLIGAGSAIKQNTIKKGYIFRPKPYWLI